MPPKVKISKEMITEAAFELTREEGIESVNARVLSERLHCSTQPILYWFKTIEEVKEAVYEKTDSYHTECLMKVDEENPMMSIGINYIEFAATEKNLFKLLFQSGGIKQKEINELLQVDEIDAIIDVLQKEIGIDENGARDIFSMLAFFTHGYASLLANNSLQYEKASAVKLLESLFKGACAAQMMGKENTGYEEEK